MLCTACGSQMKMTSEPIIEEYKGVSITALGIEHFVCDTCGEYELSPEASDELSRQLIEKYARARGLLTPSQIKAARKKLEMTQAEFESVLGVSTPTVSRWETGVMSPSKSTCNLIRLLVRNPQLAKGTSQTAAIAYQPEALQRAAHLGWTVCQGGAPAKPAAHYDTSSQRTSPTAGLIAAMEG